MKKRSVPLAPTSEVLAAASEETGFLLQRAHRRLRGALAEGLSALHLGMGHFGVLGLLSMRGDLTQQQLLEILEIDKSAMVYLIDDLQKERLVERREHPTDRRAYAVHLTDKGRKHLAAAGEISREIEAQFLSPLSASERTQLNQLLKRIGMQELGVVFKS